MKLPCKNCVVLPICQNSLGKEHFGAGLTKLAAKCCLILDYLNMEDLGLEYPSMTSSMKSRMYFNKPFATRILELFKFMNWKDRDMSHYERLSKGIYEDADESIDFPRLKEKYLNTHMRKCHEQKNV